MVEIYAVRRRQLNSKGVMKDYVTIIACCCTGAQDECVIECVETLHGYQSRAGSRPDRSRRCGQRVASKKAAVTLALKEFIARREQAGIAELLGKLEWDDSFDPKAERSRR